MLDTSGFVFHVELNDASTVFMCKTIDTQQTWDNQRCISRFSIALKKLFSGLAYSYCSFSVATIAAKMYVVYVNISKIPPDLIFHLVEGDFFKKPELCQSKYEQLASIITNMKQKRNIYIINCVNRTSV